MQCQCQLNKHNSDILNSTVRINPDLSIRDINTYLDEVSEKYGRKRISALQEKVSLNSAENPYILTINNGSSSRQQISAGLAKVIVACNGVSISHTLHLLLSETQDRKRSVSLLLAMISNGWVFVYFNEKQINTFDLFALIFNGCNLIKIGYDDFHKRFIERAIGCSNFSTTMEKLYFGKSLRGMRSYKIAKTIDKFSKEIKSTIVSAGIRETYRSKKDWILWRKIGAKKRWDINEKVYISVSPNNISSEFLKVIFDVFINSPATSMKMVINKRVANRCDGIVLYCDAKDFDGDAIKVIELVQSKTKGFSLSHRRVPFTSQPIKPSIASTGVDFRWLKLSWRQYIATTIAKALVINTDFEKSAILHQGLNIYLGLSGIKCSDWSASKLIREGLLDHADLFFRVADIVAPQK